MVENGVREEVARLRFWIETCNEMLRDYKERATKRQLDAKTSEEGIDRWKEELKKAEKQLKELTK